MADSDGKKGGGEEIKGLFDGEGAAPDSAADPLGDLFAGAKAAPAPAARTEQSTLAVLGNWEGNDAAPNLKSTQLGVAPDAAKQVAEDLAKAKGEASGQALGLAKTQMGIAPETARQVEDALAAVMGEQSTASAAKASPAAAEQAPARPLARTQLGVAPDAAGTDKLQLPTAGPTASELADMPFRESLDLQELHSTAPPPAAGAPGAADAAQPPAPAGDFTDGLPSDEALDALGELPNLDLPTAPDRAGVTDSLLDLSPTPAGDKQPDAPAAGGGGSRTKLLAALGLVAVGAAIAVVQGGLLTQPAPRATTETKPTAKPADAVPESKAPAPQPAAEAAPTALTAPGAPAAQADQVEGIDPEGGLDSPTPDAVQGGPAEAAKPAAALGGDDAAARAAAEQATRSAAQAAAADKKAAREAKRAAEQAAKEAAAQAAADKRAAREAERAAARAAKQAAAEQAAAEQAAADKAAARAVKQAAAEQAAADKAAALAAEQAAAPKSPREVIVHAKQVVKKDPARAESMLREALAGDPRNHRLMEALAEALLAQGRGKEAVELTSQIIERRPKRASYRVIHGDALKAAGDAAGAAAQWQEALAIDPDNQRALRRLGK